MVLPKAVIWDCWSICGASHAVVFHRRYSNLGVCETTSGMRIYGHFIALFVPMDPIKQTCQ